MSRVSAAVLACGALLGVAACTSSSTSGVGTHSAVSSPRSSGLSAHSAVSSPPGTAPSTQSTAANSAYTRPEIAAAKAIAGVQWKPEPDHLHVVTTVHYDTTPPTGGNHSAYWADCSGTVYAHPIANENAVHMLEHGAVWITYNAQTLPKSQLTELEHAVDGIDGLALSPYPDLKSPISLQAWNYQLFLRDVNDPRLIKFVQALRYNPNTTPELGAPCSQPTFKQHPSTFGHPLFAPAS